MRIGRVVPLALVVAVAALCAGVAAAAPDFSKLLKPTQDVFAIGKKVAKDWFKSGKFPPQKNQAEMDKAQRDLIKAFAEGCPAYDRFSFADASHYADPKALKEWKLAASAPADAAVPPGAAASFYAEWTPKGAGDKPDRSVKVTCCGLPQRLYAGSVQEPATKFEALSRETKNAQVADLLQALADDWARTNAGATIQKPAKKSAGVAKWFASATAKAGDTAEVVRRDWYAWETQGVPWSVQGETWIATVTFSNAAAADAKLAAKPEDLLKNVSAVLE